MSHGPSKPVLEDTGRLHKYSFAPSPDRIGRLPFWKTDAQSSTTGSRRTRRACRGNAGRRRSRTRPAPGGRRAGPGYLGSQQPCRRCRSSRRPPKWRSRSLKGTARCSHASCRREGCSSPRPSKAKGCGTHWRGSRGSRSKARLRNTPARALADKGLKRGAVDGNAGPASAPPPSEVVPA